MRVLMFAPNYLPSTRYGGPIRSAHGLARGLLECGHDVEILTTDVDGPNQLDVPLDRPSQIDGVQVHYCPITVPRRLYFSPCIARRAAELIPRADAVHVNGTFLWPGPHVARAARKLGKSLVISPRGMLEPTLVAGKSRVAKLAWIAFQERANFRAASAIHATSQNEAEGLRAMSLDLAPVVVIGNGVDVPAALPSASEIEKVWGDVPPGQRVAFLARLDWTKGVEMAIEAVRAHPNAVIRLAGHDQVGLRKKLEPRLNRTDGRPCGAFLGPIDGIKKWAFLAGADVLLAPSIQESFGMSVVESMAMGTPVVATEGVGAKTLLARLDASLIVRRDQAEINAALALLLSDARRRDVIGRAARNLVIEELTWKRVAQEIAILYAPHRA